MNENIQDFINEVHHNPQLKSEINEVGKDVSWQDSQPMKKNLAREIARLAARYGYEVEAEDFYPQDNEDDVLKALLVEEDYFYMPQ